MRTVSRVQVVIMAEIMKIQAETASCLTQALSHLAAAETKIHDHILVIITAFN